jgi:polygalacturonase
MKQERAGVELSRRQIVKAGAMCAGAAVVRPLMARLPRIRIFDVAKYGAVGDGTTFDSPAIQRAINEAAAYAGTAQVLVRGRKKYLIGTIELKGGIDFHLAEDAQLLASTRREDYRDQLSGSNQAGTTAAGGLIVADGAVGLTISGTGSVQGRAREFMERYDDASEWWIPKEFRPKMFVLIGCRHLQVRDITFAEAPNWGLHMLGCDGVLVDNVKIRNLLNVPNCDGIDPDHSRNVEIRNCDIVSGDDAVVVKTSRQKQDYGPAAHIRVHDCVIETQDAGVKIGTETTAEIFDVRFERCKIKTSSRGLCIQLRDEADVHDVVFRDITFASRFYSAPWWGRGEAISFTVVPRTAVTKLGKLYDIRVENVTGTAENSVRVCGSEQSRVKDVVMEHVSVTLDRTTRYQGGMFDNRPTFADMGLGQGIVPHDTPGFCLEHADDVVLRDCSVAWSGVRQGEFSYALEAQDCTGLKLEQFKGVAARAGTKAMNIS